MLDIVLLEDFVVDRQNGTARITEDMLHTVVLQCPKNNFRPCHLVRLRLVVCSAHWPVSVHVRVLAVIIVFEGIKKALEGLVFCAWVAIAGWLHHPAHAPSHHKNNCDIDHGPD